MTILLWLAGSAVALTVLGAWLSHRFGRGAYKDSYENPLNELQATTLWSRWPW
jgi:hypothetical protein